MVDWGEGVGVIVDLKKNLDFETMTLILKLGLDVVQIHIFLLKMIFLAIAVHNVQPRETERHTQIVIQADRSDSNYYRSACHKHDFGYLV